MDGSFRLASGVSPGFDCLVLDGRKAGADSYGCGDKIGILCADRPTDEQDQSDSGRLADRAFVLRASREWDRADLCDRTDWFYDDDVVRFRLSGSDTAAETPGVAAGEA